MKTCVIMQPTYLPWLGYFDLIAKSDVFVFLDHVQFSKQSWQQRNKIRDKNGVQMLTIPVIKPTKERNAIFEIEIDLAKKPLVKHIKSIQSYYSKSINFNEVFNELLEIYSMDFKYIIDLNVKLIEYGMKKFGIDKPILRSSNLGILGNKVDGIIEICNKVSAKRYLSPIGAMEYIEENNLFLHNNIDLVYQKYVHPQYKQMNYSDFISHLGFIDYLFNIKN